MATAYVEINDNDIGVVLDYMLKDSELFYDLACIFIANTSAPGSDTPNLWLNDNVTKTINSEVIKTLQDKGICVLLTVLGNHSAACWSKFTDEDAAKAFADQLSEAVIKYKLDFIDIDDEFSQGTPTNASLIMISHFLKENLKDQLLTKALFDDHV